jgi:hypothetical protein
MRRSDYLSMSIRNLLLPMHRRSCAVPFVIISSVAPRPRNKSFDICSGLGAKSLMIGLMFLAAYIGLGDVIDLVLPKSRLAGVIGESLLICGWVAMWRPIDVFLYEWWPIRRQAILSNRLSEMAVQVAPARTT